MSCVERRPEAALCHASGRDVTTKRRVGEFVKELSSFLALLTETPSSRESATANTRAPGRRTSRRILCCDSFGSAASTSPSKPVPCRLIHSATVVNKESSTDAGSTRGSRSCSSAVSAASRARR